MDREVLAGLLRGGRIDEAAALITQYTVPKVTSLTEDRIGHDLAPDTLEMLTGTFTPAGPRIMLDVDAAFSFLGNARAALLLYVGQPDEPGARLSDSGGKPLPGVDWYSVASVNGESAWAHTTRRRVVLEVDPSRAVTWQILGAIIGGGATTAVVKPRYIAITPDGTKAFVTSPTAGSVTPIRLGRPGYSYDQNLKPMDVAEPPVATGDSPTYVACDNTHAVVANVDAAEDHVTILSVATNEIVRQVGLPGGSPRGVALSPDGAYAVVGTAEGGVARVSLADGTVALAQPGGAIQAVGVSNDGHAIYAADASKGSVHKIRLADMATETDIDVGHRPHVIRVAPDGQIWVLCRPPSPAPGRLVNIDPGVDKVANDYELPFDGPTDIAIVPVAEQSTETVRTAWVVYDGGRYSQFLIGGAFAGITHSFHTAPFAEGGDIAASVAVNDYGEIWVTQPDLDRVWKWLGGRLSCRAGGAFPHRDVFFGEYCDVAVYGARG